MDPFEELKEDVTDLYKDVDRVKTIMGSAPAKEGPIVQAYGLTIELKFNRRRRELLKRCRGFAGSSLGMKFLTDVLEAEISLS